jgi:ABC-type polysaccharide/polyol phosphate export permease
MLKELNLKQLRGFIHLLLSLQKKNTFMGFMIGLIPILVTAFSIELFIGKIIGGGEHNNIGLKGINAIFFIFFSSAISQSTDALKKYSSIIKNSYLQPMTVVVGESVLQYLSFFVSFLIIAMVFQIPFYQTICLLLLSILLFIYTLLVANYLIVVSSVLEDFGRILGVIFQMLFWISPILYSIRIIQPILTYPFMLNPFYIFFELIHLIFTPADFDPHFFILGMASCLGFLLILAILLSSLRKKVLVFL